MKIRITHPDDFRTLVRNSEQTPTYLSKNFKCVGYIHNQPIYLVKDSNDLMEESMGVREYEKNFSVTCFYFLDTSTEIILLLEMTNDSSIKTFHYFDSSLKEFHPFKKNRSHEEYIVDYLNEALRDYDLHVELIDDTKKNHILKEKDKSDTVQHVHPKIRV